MSLILGPTQITAQMIKNQTDGVVDTVVEAAAADPAAETEVPVSSTRGTTLNVTTKVETATINKVVIAISKATTVAVAAATTTVPIVAHGTVIKFIVFTGSFTLLNFVSNGQKDP